MPFSVPATEDFMMKSDTCFDIRKSFVLIYSFNKYLGAPTITSFTIPFTHYFESQQYQKDTVPVPGYQFQSCQ
jgi:hypothetical protein